MSRTRIPANGNVGESAAAVARPLQSEQFKPLSRMRDFKCLIRPNDVLEKAIVHQNQDAKVEEEKEGKENISCRSNDQPAPRTSASDAEMVPRYLLHFSKCLPTYLFCCSHNSC